MPIHDFRCPDCGHEWDNLVRQRVHQDPCPQCGTNGNIVYLQAPNLDWMGMAQGASAGPEFIDRFEKAHIQRREKEEAHKREHGDDLRGAGG